MNTRREEKPTAQQLTTRFEALEKAVELLKNTKREHSLRRLEWLNLPKALTFFYPDPNKKLLTFATASSAFQKKLRELNKIAGVTFTDHQKNTYDILSVRIPATGDLVDFTIDGLIEAFVKIRNQVDAALEIERRLIFLTSRTHTDEGSGVYNFFNARNYERNVNSIIFSFNQPLRPTPG